MPKCLLVISIRNIMYVALLSNHNYLEQFDFVWDSCHGNHWDLGGASMSLFKELKSLLCFNKARKLIEFLLILKGLGVFEGMIKLISWFH